MPSRFTEDSLPAAELPERVRSILATKRLTLYRLSERSEALYGRQSPYFVPHSLYYDLRSRSFRPSAHQVFAFSRISGYRVYDWLRVFGFDLEGITRLQILLPAKRTKLLDTSLSDPNDWVTWFRSRGNTVAAPRITPLSQLLELDAPRKIASIPGRGTFMYAKIGNEDAFAFPDLLPGSIVRVRPVPPGEPTLPKKGTENGRIFLIEHSGGISCCRLRIADNGIILPISCWLSSAQLEFESPREAKILGVVDLEVRPLLETDEPVIPKKLSRGWKSRAVVDGGRFGAMLSRARAKMNLSFHEVSTMSRRIGEILKDRRYHVSLSSLHEYETLNSPPRDFRKVITLCSLYGLTWQSFLKAIAIGPEQEGADSIPDHFIFRGTRPALVEDSIHRETASAGFLEQLIEECQEMPFFLRNSVEYFGHTPRVALDDLFWIGGQRDSFHPYLVNGLLALVNRRRRTAVHFRSRPKWQQPVYMILKRDDTYIAACRGTEHNALVVYPQMGDIHRRQLLQNRDAQVVGQIVAIARKLF